MVEYTMRVEEIYLLEDGPTEVGARTSIADAEWAEQEAWKAESQPGLVLWTDGSRDENGAVGYAVAWWKRQSWAGRKAHMEYYQVAYDAECATIARALDAAADRAKRRKLGRVRIFTDAQAAIKRMTHGEPGPGQTYALQARQAIAALRKQEPAVKIEIRWYRAHKGIPGNEVAEAAIQRVGRPRRRMAEACGQEWATAHAADLPGAP